MRVISPLQAAIAVSQTCLHNLTVRGGRFMTAKTFPQTRKSSTGKVDLAREREWMIQHARDYTGQWVVLAGDRLVGHTSDSREVAALVDKARAEGICAPYVRFVSEDSAPVWMGWL